MAAVADAERGAMRLRTASSPRPAMDVVSWDTSTGAVPAAKGPLRRWLDPLVDWSRGGGPSTLGGVAVVEQEERGEPSAPIVGGVDLPPFLTAPPIGSKQARRGSQGPPPGLFLDGDLISSPTAPNPLPFSWGEQMESVELDP